MFDLTHLFVSTAWAQEATGMPPAAGGAQTALVGYLPFILIFAVFYFLVIRPQQKKFDEHSKMIKALQRGDRVVTSGGIHGKVAKLDGDDVIMLEIADGVQVKLDRSNVQGLEAKTQPVIAGEAEKK